MHTPPRTPSLALPFAVVGLAVGWLSDGFLANPLVDAIPHRDQPLAAILAGRARSTTHHLRQRAPRRFGGVPEN